MHPQSFRRILVPLDGSELSERALTYAARFATAVRAEQLILARSVPAHRLEPLQTDPVYARLGDLREAEGYLEEARAQVSATLAGVEVGTAVPHGGAADAILGEVRVREADLVIMATHGRTGLGRILFGSVAQAVLHRSPVPVLLIRAWRDASGAPEGYQQPRLLVPLDGSAFGEAALPVARDLARALDAELILFQAVPIPTEIIRSGRRVISYLDQIEAAYQREATEYLGLVRFRLLQDEPRLRVSLDVRMGPTGTMIAAAARVDSSDLVVMATHGRTGIDRAVLGSVADQALRAGTTPLLLVRPRGVALTPQAATPDEPRVPAGSSLAGVA